MAQSTIYPKKIKIIGNKVYVRDLESVTEITDENDNIIYEYDETQMTKKEYQEIVHEKLDVLEKATGVNGKSSSKGVAHRLDAIEEQLQVIKDNLGL